MADKAKMILIRVAVWLFRIAFLETVTLLVHCMIMGSVRMF